MTCRSLSSIMAFGGAPTSSGTRGRKRELQVLFYRGISDRHVNQSSILKPRDELVVFDRIEGDATGAPPEHAIIFGAKSSGGVPVRVDDPFERGSVADVTVVRGDAIEHYNDHIWINGSVVPVHNRLVGIHHLGMSGLKRAQWHHVQIRLEAFKFDGPCLGSIVSSMSRVV